MADFFRTSLTRVESATVLELAVSLRNLINKDVFSKSDPFVIFYVRDSSIVPAASTEVSRIPRDGDWIPVAMTETIWDNLNPDFVAKLVLPWAADSERPRDDAVRLSVFDRDSEDAALSKHDFIGNAEFALSDAVAASDGTLRLQLVSAKGKARNAVGKAFGNALVHAELIEDFGADAHALVVEFGFKWSVPLPSRRGYFYTISRARKGAQGVAQLRDAADELVRVHRSGVLLRPADGKADDMLFQTARLTDAELFANDATRLLRFELFEHRKSGAHERLLYFDTSVDALMRFDDARDELVPTLTAPKTLVRASVILAASSWTLSSQQLGAIAFRLANLSWARGRG